MFKEQYRRDNEKLRANDALFAEILSQEKYIERQRRKRSVLVRYGSMAAAVLLVAGTTLGVILSEAGLKKSADTEPRTAAYSLTAGSSPESLSAAPDVAFDTESVLENSFDTSASNTVNAVTSYDELYDLVSSLSDGDMKRNDGFMLGAGSDTLTSGMMAAPSENGIQPTSAPTMEAGSDYSETNVQVAGVDEADIVKTDGTYIYYLAEDRLVILEAAGKDTKLLSSTPFMDESDWWGYSSELYVAGDRLMILSEGYSLVWIGSGSDRYQSNEPKTLSMIYDISDRSHPQYVTTLGQSGSYVSSRLADGYVYTVTSQGVYQARRDTVGSFVPTLSAGSAENALAVSDVYIYDNPSSATYTVVSSFDLADGAAHESAKAMLGGAGNIYANAEHLLVATDDSVREVSDVAPDKDGNNVQITNTRCETKLVLWSLDHGTIKKLASGRVDGMLLNQFSMDEYEGAIRVVTTVEHWEERIYTDGVDRYEYDDEQYNCLYTLDQELNLLGSVEKLAEDEWVESVRFDGRIAYFVTFRQVDPLFAVDLSDPAAPKVLSALKIPGFSEYLHVFTDGRLLGIGYDADDKTGRRENVKIAMFDVSDPAAVSVRQSLSLHADWTTAGNNHKSILVSSEKNLIAFPADQKYYIFSYSDEAGFTERAAVSASYDAWSQNMRGLFIGDCFYVLADGAVTVLSLSDFSKLASFNVN